MNDTFPDRRWVPVTRSGCFGILVTLIAATTFSVPNLSTAQIYYTTPGPTNFNLRPTAVLRRVNPDGTGNIALPLQGIPAPQAPTFSRDGRFLALTSLDPTRPTDQSQSIFELDVLTGRTRRLIFFRDQPDQQSGGKIQFFPLNKAYSPSRRLMAVSVLMTSFGGSEPPGAVAGLQIHDLANGLPVAFPVQTPVQDGIHTSGVGVDWSPDGSRIAYPIVRVGPNGASSVTPIYLVDPNNGQLQQLTNPTDSLQQSAQPPRIITTGEHDYAPAFSPNGQALAYIRATQQRDTAVNVLQGPALRVDIRITSRNGDRSIFTLNSQRDLIASRVRWSPSGSRLVFDIAPRARGPLGAPMLQPDTAQLTTLTMNVDGSDIRRVAAAPAAQPDWGIPRPVGPNPGVSRNLPDLSDYGSVPTDPQ